MTRRAPPLNPNATCKIGDNIVAGDWPQRTSYSTCQLSDASLNLAISLSSATTLEQCQAALTQCLTALGFSYFEVLRLSLKNGTPSCGVILTSMPQQWTSLYSDNYSFVHDPILRVGIMSEGPFTWASLRSILPSHTAGTSIQNARELILADDGIVIPIHDTNGCAAIFNCAFTHNTASDLIATTAMVCAFAYTRLMALSVKNKPNPVALTNRELECLQWAATGKTDWEIGAILNVSKKTVNFHIESAKTKLGVSTRIQAVVYASRIVEEVRNESRLNAKLQLINS